MARTYRTFSLGSFRSNQTNRTKTLLSSLRHYHHFMGEVRVFVHHNMRTENEEISNDTIDIGVDGGCLQASLDSKSWPASDKAKQFVKETVVILANK